MGFQLPLSFHHPSISHKTPPRLALHVVPTPQGLWSLLVSKNYDNAKNKEQNGMLMIPAMCYSKTYGSKSHGSKSHLLFQFTLVTALSPRTLKLSELCVPATEGWGRINHPVWGPGCPVLSSSVVQRGERCPHKVWPLLRWSPAPPVVFGRCWRLNMLGDDFIQRVCEVLAGELQSWAACICLPQIYHCPQVCDLSYCSIG